MHIYCCRVKKTTFFWNVHHLVYVKKIIFNIDRNYKKKKTINQFKHRKQQRLIRNANTAVRSTRIS